MRIDIITLFPKMFEGPFDESIIGRAIDNGKVEFHLHDFRQYALDRHKTVDDTPYGGGSGMVLKVDVLGRCITEVKKLGRGANGRAKAKVILLTPQGKLFNQTLARNLVKAQWLILICGHYEGFDERIRPLVDEEISIGDYVLTGGELPAMVLVDTVTRLLPGVLGKDESSKSESHEEGILEYPQYTRPAVYRGSAVPRVLVSGDHAAIKAWRQEQSIEKTKKNRPDLLT